MSVKSGGGAAVSSGADYQARVAAYFIAGAFCDAPIEEIPISTLTSIGFETAEPVDDLNLEFPDHSCFLQIKRKLSFSLDAGTDLFSAMEQFSRQITRRATRTECFVVTSSESSRKVTTEMRAALNAFRLGEESAFRRDQPAQAVSIVDALLDSLASMSSVETAPERLLVAKKVLRQVHVLVLDIDESSGLEHAVLLLLSAKGIKFAPQVWRKMIVDCIAHSAQRHTVSIKSLRERYAKFETPEADSDEPRESKEFIEHIQEGTISAGREVVLGQLLEPDGKPIWNADLVLMEFFRFDNDCKERLIFKDGLCRMGNGLQVKLVRRSATMKGLMRYIKSHSDLFSNNKLTIIQSNLKEDYDESLCAMQHRERLLANFNARQDKLACLHCGKPVSSADSDLIELSGRGEPEMGLTHPACTRCDDRVLGTIKSKFFDQFHFLINLDVNLWFRKIQRGQGFFSSDRLPENARFAWSGIKSSLKTGDFIIESTLQDGTVEFVRHRGRLHRLTKAEADEQVQKSLVMFEEAKTANDPYSYSDQSKAFGKRSQLLSILGLSEKIRAIMTLKVIPYDRQVEALVDEWENWYAPIIYLRDAKTGRSITLGQVVPVMTDPLELGNYLENWEASAMPCADYEVAILADDREFDDFIDQVIRDGFQPVINPIFTLIGDDIKPVSGHPIIPLEVIGRKAQT